MVGCDRPHSLVNRGRGRTRWGGRSENGFQVPAPCSRTTPCVAPPPGRHVSPTTAISRSAGPWRALGRRSRRAIDVGSLALVPVEQVVPVGGPRRVVNLAG